MNEYKDLADSLNKDKEYIPRARRIFNNLNTIEAILYTGITFNSLATILRNNGFEITFKQLKNDIYQARKKLKATGIVKSNNTQQQNIFAPAKNINEEKETVEENPQETENPTPKQKPATANKLNSVNSGKTTKEIMAETERYNEQHEVEKAKKEQAQRDKKLLALIDKQNKDK